MWALFPPRPQVLRHDGMRKITEANQCSRQLHSAQRYRLVCTEAQVVVAVHAAGDAAGTTLRQLSFTAFLATHARLRSHANQVHGAHSHSQWTSCAAVWAASQPDALPPTRCRTPWRLRGSPPIGPWLRVPRATRWLTSRTYCDRGAL
jgi:hypothetical protein